MQQQLDARDSLVSADVVRRWDEAFRSGSDKRFPSLELVRLEKWYFKSKPGRTLDYGCGSGVNLIYMLESGYRVDGVDASIEGVRLVQSKLDGMPAIRSDATLSHIRPDALRLPFEDGTFDYVICFSVLSLLGNRDRVGHLLEEFHRVMKPGAKAIIDINGATSDFARDGTAVADDIYEYRDGPEVLPFLCYCPKDEETFATLFEPYFKMDDLGMCMHRYMHSEIFEYIACVRKP